MDNLTKKLRDAQKEEEKAIKERQKVEAELLAHTFYQKGWDKRGEYEEEKRASEAAKVLNEHKRKYHSANK